MRERRASREFRRRDVLWGQCSPGAGRRAPWHTGSVANTDAAAVIRERLRAFNAHDVHPVLTGLTDDALWITGTTVVRGHDELGAFFSRASAKIYREGSSTVVAADNAR